MSFRRRFTRKQFLNQPDQFIATSQNTVEFIQQNARLITSVLIGAACFLVFGGLVYLYSNRVSADAQKLEVEALDLYHRPILNAEEIASGKRGFKSDEERYQVSLSRFKRIVDEFGRTQTAQRAMLYIGDCYYGLGEFEKAKESYEEYLSKYPDDELMQIILRQNLGYISEAQGKLDEAIGYYQQALKQTTPSAGFLLYLNIARCYELKQNWQQALVTYNEGVSAYPEEPKVSDIRQHIQELEAIVSSANPPQPSS